MPYAYMYSAWDKTVDKKAQVEKITKALENKENFKKLEINFSYINQDTREILISNKTYN